VKSRTPDKKFDKKLIVNTVKKSLPKVNILPKSSKLSKLTLTIEISEDGTILDNGDYTYGNTGRYPGRTASKYPNRPFLAGKRLAARCKQIYQWPKLKHQQIGRLFDSTISFAG
jgi:hypothetical protein